jgi:hypothetical protein
VNFAFILPAILLAGVSVWQLRRAWRIGWCNFPPVDIEKRKFPTAFWVNVVGHVSMVGLACWMFVTLGFDGS